MKNMRKITKIRRSIKAISPVISVLLMIAIAVVASLVVYAWIMGYIGGTTTKAGQAIQIQSYAPGVDNQHVVIYVQNIGQGSVDLSQSGSVYINDQGVPINSSVTIAVGETKAIIADLTGTSLTWIPGEQIKIKVVTNDGTFMQASGTGAGGSSGTPVIVHTITASADSNGQIIPFGQVPVNDGASLAFSITPNNGYQIADVLVDGVSQGAISSYTFTNVVADHSISVSFTAITFTITVSAGSGGSIDPAGPSVSVNYGADQAFSITAGSGYHIVDVLVDGASQGAISSYTFTNVQADHEISATFAPTIVQHKVSFAQTGSGSTVTVSYQIDGGSVQTGNCPFNVMVTSGHTISYTYPDPVSGASGVRYVINTAASPASPQTVGSSDISISATYKTQYQVTFDASANVKGDSTANLVVINTVGHTLPYTTGWLNSGVDTLNYAFQSPIASTGSPSTTRYLWTSTSSTGGLGQTTQSNIFTVSGTGTITATYTTQTFKIDTSGTGYTNTNSAVTVSLSNCAAGDVIIVMGSARSNLVSSVTDNLGTHLTWTQRGTVDVSGTQRISEWRAVFSTGGSITITVTFPSSDTTYGLSAVAFAISGANTASPFDTHTGLPYTATGSGSAPSVTGVSTTNAHDMIIGLQGSRAATTETAGTGFTLITSITSAGGSGAAEDNVVTSTLSSATVSFGTSTTSWAMIADAVQRAW
jgi:hypothetical protein